MSLVELDFNINRLRDTVVPAVNNKGSIVMTMNDTNSNENSNERHVPPGYSADNSDLILRKLESLESGQKILQEEIIQVKSDLKINTAMVASMNTKLDGFDYKLEGQNSKIEGQDVKIELSRYKTQYWLVAVIVAVVVVGLRILESLPEILQFIAKVINGETENSILFILGFVSQRCKTNIHTLGLFPIQGLQKFARKLRAFLYSSNKRQ